MEITNRERQVLQLIAEEYTSKEIANKLFLSTETINSHRKNIKNKLKAKNTAGLISRAYRQGLMVVSTVLLTWMVPPSSLLGQTNSFSLIGEHDQCGAMVVQIVKSIDNCINDGKMILGLDPFDCQI